MFNTGPQYQDAEDGFIYPTLEAALCTCCPICGDKLEWSLKVIYDAKMDCPAVVGSALSCGIVFALRTIIQDDYSFLYTLEFSQ